MKLEMGESLGSSWLKHVKKCQIVQTNWKASPCWKIKHDEHELSNFLMQLKQFYLKRGLDVFKNNKKFQQILHQTECDVIGYSLFNNPSFYSLEVAYHGKQGLNYGAKKVTIAKVIAKLLKSALAFYCFFDVKEAEVGFASPKIGPAILKELQSEISNLQELFDNSEFQFRFSFKLYTNQIFTSEIMDKVIILSDSIADTGELFLRSFQLYDLVNDTESVDESDICPHSKINSNLPKIAQLVKNELIPVLQQDDFPQEEINDFLDLQFTKDVFKLAYPLLSLSRIETTRYYATPLLLHGKNYYLCNDWYEKNRGALVEWLEQHSAERN